MRATTDRFTFGLTYFSRSQGSNPILGQPQWHKLQQLHTEKPIILEVHSY